MNLACEKCGEIIIKSMDQTVKVRSKVVLIKGSGSYAVCKGCGSEISIPLKIDESFSKSIESPRLYIKKS